MSSPNHSRPAAGPQLIQDAPIVAIIDRMAADLARLRELAPASDGRATLELYLRDLTNALRDARAGDLWVSTEETARMRGTTPQAVTYLCRKGKLVARKRGGAWEVHKDSINADTRRAA